MSRQFDTLQLTDPNGLLLGPTAAGHTFATLGTAAITLPDASGIIVTDTATLTLTNKTVTDPSNNVAASALQTNTGVPVSVFAATAPTVNQVLTATGPTTAVWMLPGTNGLIASTGTGTGSGGTPVVLETFNTADNTTYSIATGMAARRTDVAGTGAGIGLNAGYRRGVGAASLVRVGPSTVDDLVRFRDDNTWTLQTQPNTTSGVISLIATFGAGQTVACRSSTTIQAI